MPKIQRVKEKIAKEEVKHGFMILDKDGDYWLISEVDVKRDKIDGNFVAICLSSYLCSVLLVGEDVEELLDQIEKENGIEDIFSDEDYKIVIEV